MKVQNTVKTQIMKALLSKGVPKSDILELAEKRLNIIKTAIILENLNDEKACAKYCNDFIHGSIRNNTLINMYVETFEEKVNVEIIRHDLSKNLKNSKDFQYICDSLFNRARYLNKTLGRKLATPEERKVIKRIRKEKQVVKLTFDDFVRPKNHITGKSGTVEFKGRELHISYLNGSDEEIQNKKMIRIFKQNRKELAS